MGAPKNTVWNSESSYSKPHKRFVRKMAELARQEGFMKDFKLVGSVTILGDLEEGSREIAALFNRRRKKRAPPARR